MTAAIPVFVNGRRVATLTRRHSNPSTGRMQYYAFARRPDGKIGELLVTRESGRHVSQEWTGRTFPSLKAVAAAVEALNRELFGRRNARRLVVPSGFSEPDVRGAFRYLKDTGQLARGVFRTNPVGPRHSPGSPCLANEAELYRDVERIYARKGPRSAAVGERFYHDFRQASACGRPDGTVVLRGRGGRRLWRLYESED